MTSEQTPRGAVQAVVVHDGRLLLVDERGGWRLPSGTPEPAETSRATAARVVHETTGYLVDGSSELDPQAAGEGEAAFEAVVCQLLTADPSSGARLAPEQIRWVPVAEAAHGALPGAVRDYLAGHTPV
ncbi:NUDIX domain-containing protein [Streptomyces sp. NPDC057197]|uniref:NUDIX domain-containing protein n=1 Tax=Streptomyces sp. NPDC057197 TaxID=3346045 RepID=UPI0036351FD9